MHPLNRKVNKRRLDRNRLKQKSSKLFGISLCLFLFCQGCFSSDFENEPGVLHYDNPDSIFNKNILSIRQLVCQEEDDGILTAIDSSNIHTYAFYYKNQDSPVILCRNNHFDIKWPNLSVKPVGPNYYWAIGNSFLLGKDGKKILVTDDTHIPQFEYTNGRWSIKLNALREDIPDNLLTDNFMKISVLNGELAVLRFSSLYELAIPMESFNPPLVPLQSFYKDIFLDAGIGLTSRKYLYAARYLGLSSECISLPRSGATVEDSVLQNEIIAGNEKDTNGCLLYPDGQPRFKLFFVNGGSATTHGKSMSNNAMKNIRSFVNNGGSYVGTCAGAFYASNGYDGNTDYPYYLSLWPAIVNRTGVSNTKIGICLNQDSPLLNYYDFGGDYYVNGVRHNKGCYPMIFPEGTEILALYDYPLKEEVHGQPCIWAYKSDKYNGKVVLCGSHPEEVSEGEQMDLTAALLLYAIDGLGLTPLKGFLQNGKTRIMNSNTEDNKPHFTKIGDLQCHHFAVNIPEGAENIRISLYSDLECSLSLSLAQYTFAYPENAEYISADMSSRQSLFFSSLESGLWFVCVKCNTSIEVKETDYGQNYIDTTGVLNGIPYQITVSWDTTEDKGMASSINNILCKKQLRKVNSSTLVFGLDGKEYRTPPSDRIYLHHGKKVLSGKYR